MTNINQTIDRPFEIWGWCRSAGNVTNTESPLGGNNETCRENRIVHGAKHEDPFTRQ